MKQRTERPAEQKAHEDVIALFVGIPFGLICAALLWSATIGGHHTIDANASRAAVDQVQDGGR